LLFSFKGTPTGDTSLYEIGINGKGLRRITDPGKDVAVTCAKEAPGTVGSGQHDITPAYLPDARPVPGTDLIVASLTPEGSCDSINHPFGWWTPGYLGDIVYKQRVYER